MLKGGERLGNEESSEETSEESGEEEVIPALNHTPGVRPLTPGVVFLKDILLKNFQNRLFDRQVNGLPTMTRYPSLWK